MIFPAVRNSCAPVACTNPHCLVFHRGHRYSCSIWSVGFGGIFIFAGTSKERHSRCSVLAIGTVFGYLLGYIFSTNH